MLGGAQFKATLLAVKRVPAVSDAERQRARHREDGKQLSAGASSQLLGAAHSRKFPYPGGQRAARSAQGVTPEGPRAGGTGERWATGRTLHAHGTAPQARPTLQGGLSVVPFG